MVCFFRVFVPVPVGVCAGAVCAAGAGIGRLQCIAPFFSVSLCREEKCGKTGSETGALLAGYGMFSGISVSEISGMLTGCLLYTSVGRGVQTCPEASQAFRFADMGAFGQFIECDGGGVVVFDIFEETFHARGDRVVRFFRRDADVFQQVEP